MASANIFDKCMPTIWEHEGGYSDVEGDRGGATKYGISLLFLKGTKDIDGNGFLDGDINKDGIVNDLDVKALTKDNAKLLYFQYFWSKYFNLINNYLLVLHLFDVAVNSGKSRAAKMIQRIVGVKDDGIFGMGTVTAINQKDIDSASLVSLYKQSRKDFYTAIVKNNPSQEKFLKGWMNRVDTTLFH